MNEGSAAFFEPVKADDPRGFPTIPGLHPVRLLGRGASATVWLAREQAPIARSVAVKVLDAGRGGGDELERFRREWSAVARAAGEGVANLISAGTAPDGRAYLVLEFIDGELIVEACERRSLPLSSRLELVAQLCDIVGRIHGAGVVHRDLKPSNIMVSFAVAPPRVTVLDFGVARIEGADRALTIDGAPLGTPEWMAPEQTGLAPVAAGPAADLWAIGLLVERLWTGCAPYDRGDGSPEAVRALLAQVARAERRWALPPGPRPSWDDLRSEAREELAVALRRLCRREPTERGADAGELASLLRRIAGSGRQVGQPRARPSRWLGALLGVAALGAVFFVAWRGRAGAHALEAVPLSGLRAWACGVDHDGRCALPTDGRFVAIAVGSTYTLAVRADGSVLALGSNADGAAVVPPALGDRPVRKAIDVAAREDGAAALLEDGSVVCWGRRAAFPADAARRVVAIDARRTALLALRDDGSLAIDGPAPGGMVEVPAGQRFARVRVGHKTAAALGESGELVVWGSDATGMVANGSALRARDFDFAGRDSALSSLGVVLMDGSVRIVGAELKAGAQADSLRKAQLIAGAVGAEWFVVAWEDGGVAVLGDAPVEVVAGARGLLERPVRLRSGAAHVVALLQN